MAHFVKCHHNHRGTVAAHQFGLGNKLLFPFF
ncbi:Uncharacterised protein [Vibrio cholerae]|nr:Uncharacterised protein [Vibrio cholerae]